MLALLLLPGALSAAATRIDVASAKLSSGSEARQATWLLSAAAQEASAGQAPSLIGAAEHKEARRASSQAATAAAAEVLPRIAAKAAARGHASLQHHPRHVRLPLPASGTLLRVAAAEAVVAAAAVAPLMQAAAGAVHTRSEHSETTSSSSSSSSSGGSVPSSRVLVAAGEQQDSSSSSNRATGCSTVTAHNGPPNSPSHSTLPPRDSSNNGTVQVTAGTTQGPPSNQQSATPGSSSNSGSSSNNNGGTLPAQQRAGLQAGDVIVRGGSDGSWHCIRRPGCKPYALAFGAAFRPLMASGECQLMGGCEAVQKQGACNAPFSWEVDRQAAAVVQYCGQQCKCPGES
jgi:hypothetical protein